jgi:hypothetical protein
MPTGAVSRLKKALSSWIVLISGAGKTTVEFLSTELDQGLEVAQLQRERVGHHHVGGAGQLAGGERLALRGDDPRALLAFSLGLTGHRTRHGLGELDVLELDDRDLDAPVLGLDVEDLAYGLVDRVGLDSFSSGVWRPTPARSVVCAIGLVAAETFSIATTERIGSAMR